jgi:multidrug efflux pump subunit AcrA (membrane-fusion protein)
MPSPISMFDRRCSLARRSGSVVLFVVLILLLVAGGGGLVWYYFRAGRKRGGRAGVDSPGDAGAVRTDCARTRGGGEFQQRGDPVRGQIGGHRRYGDHLGDRRRHACQKGGQAGRVEDVDAGAGVGPAADLLQYQPCDGRPGRKHVGGGQDRATEYLEGTFRQQEQEILSAIFVAEEALRRAELGFQSTERLAARGIVRSLQLEGDQFAVEKARNELESAQTKLHVLRQYTKEKTLKQFDSDITIGEAKYESEQESYRLELEKLEEIREQIANCTIVAPDDGQVVHANTTSGSTEFVVEPGAMVRENQVLIRLPDPSKMQVKATINESRISLVRSGMPAAIQFDALRNQTVHGRVTRVNQYAEPTSWRSGNIKQYAAFIEIYDPPLEVRSGMNAEVRIFVDQQEDSLQVPVQALYETKGQFFCLVKDGDRWETRLIRVGSSNDSFMTIESGLSEGEVLVMNPRAYAERLELPYIPDPVAPGT